MASREGKVHGGNYWARLVKFMGGSFFSLRESCLALLFVDWRWILDDLNPSYQFFVRVRGNDCAYLVRVAINIQ